ncbi:iron transporter (plasmid) [Halarchaeum sp. CBA1220]|uniref:iron transporter n=1 Tax=Halarchaeum sp. CBA1220 TaxID=1853682 RepID=UPI000F3AA6F4|nr:iron transporter [Halarchaeum sp. CBA1220]QLC35397.1 iron transporter [Halarchaeum sp. CBA1220]
MRRRRALSTAGTLGVAALAGCTGLFNLEERAFSAPPVVENRPNAVYYPSHVEQMQMVGMATQGDYACALSYTYPHRFWLVTGADTNRVTIGSEDTMHLMVSIWHRDSGTIVSDVAPSVHLTGPDGGTVSNAPWSMLSQPMGFHFGDNVQLPKEGTYDVSVDVGAPSATRTGTVADAPDSLSFDFTLNYARSTLRDVEWRRLPEKQGTRGAVEPMDMKMLPSGAVPTAEAVPGSVRGRGSIGDSDVVAAVLDDATRFGGSEDDTYLVVSPRTPHNRFPLPAMGVNAVVEGTDHDLTETLDSTLGLHYGAVLDADPANVSLRVAMPPQIARHEGYETAFLEAGAVGLDS